MQYNQEDILQKLSNWDLGEDISEIACDNERALKIYGKLQTYFQNYFLHFDNIMRISRQLDIVLQDFTRESDRIGEVAAFIKKGADRQTAEIDKSMALVKDFSDKVNAIYERSKGIISLAYDMENSNRAVQESVGQLVVNQEKNDHAMLNIFDLVSHLISKTEKIGEITAIMKRISTETLLLGLNAKVEAAHAGVHGKGFSVVAGEIQRLSEESKAAAEDINETVKSVSDEIGLIEKAAQESRSLFQVQKDTVTEVDSVFKKNCETIDTYISEQKSFNASIAEIKTDELTLTNTISNIVTSVREIAATVNEIGSVLLDHNNSISLMDKLKVDIACDINSISQQSRNIKVQKSAPSKKRVAFLFDIDHPFYTPTKTEAIKAAGVYHFDVQFFAPQTRGEATKEQAAHLDTVLEEKYDGLVISPINDELICQKLRQISNAGTKIVFLNSRIEGVEHVSLIMTDGMTIGAAAARIVMGALGNHGEAIVNAWTGMKLDAIENRKNGFVQELKRNSRIQVHEYPVKSNPTPDEAEAIIQSMLQSHPAARFLYMTNLEWGMFAANYMRKHHSDVQVITVDFSEEVEKAIRDGQIHYSLGQRPYLWGSTAIRMIDKSLNKQKVQPVFDTGAFEVNRLNIDIYADLA